jgi:hypothetical protein
MNLALMLVNEQAFKSAAGLSTPAKLGAVAFGRPTFVVRECTACCCCGGSIRAFHLKSVCLRAAQVSFSAQGGEAFSLTNRY